MHALNTLQIRFFLSVSLFSCIKMTSISGGDRLLVVSFLIEWQSSLFHFSVVFIFSEGILLLANLTQQSTAR